MISEFLTPEVLCPHALNNSVIAMAAASTAAKAFFLIILHPPKNYSPLYYVKAFIQYIITKQACLQY
jgi:hypothetical protein